MKFQSSIGLLAATAALPIAFAQTWTACDPTKKSCPCDPALGGTHTWDFTKGPSSLLPADPNFKAEYKSDGLHLPVTKKGDAPTIIANKYIFWGKLECTLKIAPGKGIVSSLVFQSDDLDEIDFEWIGSKSGEAQSNYFGKGNTEQYNRGAYHPVADSANTFHKYGIEWTPEKTNWYIDGVLVRTLTPANSMDHYGKSGFYPQTPMQIKIGSWAAGDPSNAKGTIEWADGPIDYSQAPFSMVISSLTLTDYTTSGTQYCFGDRSGSAESIIISKDPIKSTKDNVSSAADDDKKTSSAAEDKKTSSAPASAKPSTLSTSKSASASEKESTTAAPASKTSSAAKSSVTQDIASAITQGVPDSMGNPQNKGVTTTGGTAVAAEKTTGAQTTNNNVPSSASSVRNAGFAVVVAAVFAALMI